MLQFAFTNNLGRHLNYGIIGRNRAPGNDTISAFFPGSRITSNVIADGVASRYPAGNQFPSTTEFRAQFVNFSGGDFRLIATSAWKRAASDGGDIGCSAAVVNVSREPFPVDAPRRVRISVEP